jgi:hypothetical protein
MNLTDINVWGHLTIGLVCQLILVRRGVEHCFENWADKGFFQIIGHRLSTFQVMEKTVMTTKKIKRLYYDYLHRQKAY